MPDMRKPIYDNREVTIGSTTLTLKEWAKRQGNGKSSRAHHKSVRSRDAYFGVGVRASFLIGNAGGGRGNTGLGQGISLS